MTAAPMFSPIPSGAGIVAVMPEGTVQERTWR